MQTRRLILVLCSSVISLSACRTTLMQKNRRSMTEVAPNVSTSEQFVNALGQISEQSSQVVSSVNTALSVPVNIAQRFRVSLPSTATPSSTVRNPLDLLRRLLNEIGVARPSQVDGKQVWTWESLSGRRLMGTPVQLSCIDSGDHQNFVVTLNPASGSESFTIASAGAGEPGSVQVELDQLTKLYQSMSNPAKNFPDFAMQGNFRLLNQDQEWIIEAAEFAWKTDKIKFTARAFRLAFSSGNGSLRSFELRGTIEPRDIAQPPRNLQIHAEKSVEQGTELNFEFE